MNCDICGNFRHIYDDKAQGWRKCKCQVQMRVNIILKQLSVSLQDVSKFNNDGLLIKIRDYFGKDIKFKHPLFVFGSADNLKVYSAAIFSTVLSLGIENIAAVDMFDMVDDYFNNSSSFKEYLRRRLLITLLGSEVCNLGAVKTIEAICQRCLYNRFFPIFLSIGSSLEGLLVKYPDELKDVFKLYGVNSWMLR